MAVSGLLVGLYIVLAFVAWIVMLRLVRIRDFTEFLLVAPACTLGAVFWPISIVCGRIYLVVRE